MVAAAVAVAFGGVERWWVATHPVGALTSDGAVVGLMALHLIHHGQLPAYFWGQAYGGSVEALLTSGVFLLAGAGPGQLMATTALSSALAALALWRTGRLVVGERAAVLGALAFWVWPASFIWRSLKPGGTYMLGLTLSLCAVGALLKLRAGDDGPTRVAAAGLLVGLAWWASPMSLQLLVPGAVWCAVALVRLGRRLVVLVGAAVVGAFPAVVFGATHGWGNLRLPGGNQSVLTGIPSRLAQFFRIEAPLVLSLRVQRSFVWIGAGVGRALAVGAGVGLVAVVVLVVAGRAERCRLPVLTAVVLPVLFSLNPLANHVGQDRYVMFGASFVLLLAGVGLDNAGSAGARLWSRLAARLSLWGRPSGRPSGRLATRRAGRRTGMAGTVSAVGLAAVAGLGMLALSKGPPALLVGFATPDVPMPVNDDALQSLVAAHHVHDAYAYYWIAYRLTFETGEAVTVASTGLDRYPPFQDQVARSPDPAYLFISASVTTKRFETWCRDHAVAFSVWTRGPFTVVQPRVRVVPTELPRHTVST